MIHQCLNPHKPTCQRTTNPESSCHCQYTESLSDMNCPWHQKRAREFNQRFKDNNFHESWHPLAYPASPLK